MQHISVLLKETIELIPIKENSIYFDLTGGAGGHSMALLQKIPSSSQLYIFDQDPLAIKHLTAKFSCYHNVKVIHANFCMVKSFIIENNLTNIMGVIADLGLSTDQINDPLRGFSYMQDNSLDMRMDTSQSNNNTLTILNYYPYEKLVKIFAEYGEIKNAGYFTKMVINNRPYTKAEQLVMLCDTYLPAKGHSAKKPFQALRIATNNELAVLAEMLIDITNYLAVGGVLAVISFHSLEDRIVKHYFNELTKVKIDKKSPLVIEPTKDFCLLTTKPILPSKEEISCNKRAHSALLRAIKKIKVL